MEVLERDNARMDIQLHKVLRMNGGDGHNSYANNSPLQNKVILRVKPILQESIADLYSKNFPDCITMADMGCSSGPNTFLPIWQVIEALDETCRRLNRKPPILQVFLNDLPENDFNFIFKTLPSFHKKLEEEKGSNFGPCFIAAMPGNFYERLFPPHSLHFVYSSYSLQWCSEVPKIPVNKGNIYLAKTSPPSVHRAYLNQFEKDMKAFLSCRSEEIIQGGHMFITIYGRDDNYDDSSHKYTPNMWELLGITLNDMVSEGLIEESKLDSFNIPVYGPSAEELKNLIEAQGSFTINRLETFKVGWVEAMDNPYKDSMDKYKRGKHIASRIRGISESLLAFHFGCEFIDNIFQRFSIKIEEQLELTMDGGNTNHVVSMTKK
ncbi:hypothetical protein P3X46_018069 [Hevea brasiliensis]|uniref:Uncharacterized protein n=2 Tax=Hevea brasiliensis TaxID=3981 RepID=A0ABQ9LPM7_HEVBR|nr:hypothetical protein P3X46_018069 [Hevea brasiliensis]